MNRYFIVCTVAAGVNIGEFCYSNKAGTETTVFLIISLIYLACIFTCPQVFNASSVSRPNQNSEAK